jgi:ketosteroid isomerase-like protein
MSQENVEIVRRALETYIESGLEAYYERWYAEDCVGEDFPELPDGGSYRGREGLRERLSNFQLSWGDDLVLEPVDLVDGGGDTVIVDIAVVGRGDHSGLPLDAHFFFLLDLRDGLVVRDRAFRTRSQAFEAAGLSE